MFSASFDRKLLARAKVAWYKQASKEAKNVPAPSDEDSSLREFAGKNYVVLRSSNSLLAIYRITNRQELKRLRRWPAELERAQ